MADYDYSYDQGIWSESSEPDDLYELRNCIREVLKKQKVA